jgi:site-specific DNA-methyltransferase (adenine-specific)
LIVLARKPLSEGTVAANVVKWGTGAINVDGCRVPITDDAYAGNCSGDRGHADNRSRDMEFAMGCGRASSIGRWPANVIHDGSEEVVAAFPESKAAYGNETSANAIKGKPYSESEDRNTYGAFTNGVVGQMYSDSGSAARFFYTAKADSDDRLGSKHPTVKPLDLIQYLVRLITPPKGICLDPFAGTGTTGEAAWREGMSAVLIEREAEYCADIRRRMALALAGPDERARENIKARNLPRDDGPLFSGIPEAEAL